MLDLADRRAEMAGRLLADLGARVVKLEPPGGVDSRRMPPFEAGREDDLGASLYWASVGLGKKSVVCDLETPEGVAAVRALAGRADVLIESFDPGGLARLGLGVEALHQVNPRLIVSSVTPFGQSGPKAHWPATELTLEAAGGRVGLQGDPDRPPLPMGFPHSWFHGGAQAAADIVVALNERAASGLGQHLDTSVQECLVWTLMGAYTWPAMLGADPPGAGDDRMQPIGVSDMARLFPRLCACADGWVAVAMGPMGQSTGGGMIPQVMRELRAQGRLDPELERIDWEDWARAYFDGELSEETIVLAVSRVEEYLAERTKSELLEWTLQHKLRLGPVCTTADLLAEPHLAAREVFEELGGRLHPGPPARGEGLPRHLPGAAPRLGEHQDLLAELLGDAPETHERELEAEGARPTDRGPTVVAPPARSGEAFAGLKVADFSWVVAGPTIGKALADHGATVVRVESARRPDLARILPPMKDGEESVNRGGWAALYNTSKRSLALDLSRPEGRDLAKRLVAWADVVIQSYSPGTMDKLGLGWSVLSEGRSDLVMLSTSLFGTGGRLEKYAAYGQQAAAVVGLHAVTGWPDRPPCGPYGPYTDVIAPKYGVCALASALLERRRTGKGQHIELSQAETGIRFLEPLLLDQTVNDRTAVARGMASEVACPHGIYAGSETERYVAISVESEAHWRALLEATSCSMFSPELSAGARAEQRAAIDDFLTGWCASRSVWEIEQTLVRAGAPCSVVQRPTDLYSDPHLEGARLPAGARARRDGTVALRRFRHPLLGEGADAPRADTLSR